MKVKVLLFFFISSISLVSCKEKSANDLFESFVHKKLNEKYIVLKTASVNSIESLDKDYRKIIENHSKEKYIVQLISGIIFMYPKTTEMKL